MARREAGQGVAALDPVMWGAALASVLETLEVGDDHGVTHAGGHLRGAWLLLQESSFVCGPGSDEPDCHTENAHILFLVVMLCLGICSTFGIFVTMRDDKEEQLTPLSPQLIVKDPQLHFRVALDDESDFFEVLDSHDEIVCKAVLDWPDPLKTSGISCVTATVRLQNSRGTTLATVVARSGAPDGQTYALCRTSCEVFGFVEADPVDPNFYTVRHRSGVELLELRGEFDTQSMSVSVVSCSGIEVCTVRRVGDICYGTMLEYVDAGMVLCALFATHVHRQIEKLAPEGEILTPIPSPSGSRPTTPMPTTPMQTPRQQLQPPQLQPPPASPASATWPPPPQAFDAPEDPPEGEADVFRERSGSLPFPIMEGDPPWEARAHVVPPLRGVRHAQAATVAEQAPIDTGRPLVSMFPSPQVSSADPISIAVTPLTTARTTPLTTARTTARSSARIPVTAARGSVPEASAQTAAAPTPPPAPAAAAAATVAAAAVAAGPEPAPELGGEPEHHHTAAAEKPPDTVVQDVAPGVTSTAAKAAPPGKEPDPEP